MGSFLAAQLCNKIIAADDFNILPNETSDIADQIVMSVLDSLCRYPKNESFHGYDFTNTLGRNMKDLQGRINSLAPRSNLMLEYKAI